MSLAVLADHMASKGRGPDSMLVHMSPREVRGLQALAKAHGGSLTINPETGLPEAGFLDKLMPMVIGAAITATTGIPALEVGLGMGAFETIRTGDLGKGISAGLGAYGGASLTGSFMDVGTGALGAETSEAARIAAEQAGREAAAWGASQGLSQEGIDALRRQAIDEAGNAVGSVTPNASSWDKISKGFEQVTSSPTAGKDFLASNWKSGLSAMAPILADQAVAANMPTTTTRPGRIRTFSYNPYNQYYTPTGNYDATVSAAGGGLMGLSNGGQFDLVSRNEPVVRMDEGGVAGFAGSYGDPNYVGNLTDKFTDAQVASYIQNNNLSGAGLANAAAMFNVTPEQISRAQGLLSSNDPSVGAASQAYNAAVTADPNVAAQNAQTVSNAQAVLDAYANIGRTGIGTTQGTIDQAGYDYWLDKLNTGALSRDDLSKTFGRAVNEYLVQNPEDAYSNYVENFVVNKYAQPTGTAEEFLTGTSGAGVYGQALADALRKTNFSLGAQYGLTHSDIGDPRNIEETYGGLKGVSSNINFWVDDYVNNPANTAKTGAEKRLDAWNELGRWGLNESDVVRATGKTLAELFKDAEIKKITTGVTPTGFYGNETNPGDKTINPDGSITVHPNIPGRPYGGFSGMGEVRDAYTQGGGSLGYIPYAPKTMEEFNTKYNKLTGGSKQAYEHLMGITPYSPTPWTRTGEVMKPYSEAVLGIQTPSSSKQYLFDPATKTYKINPDYIPVSYSSTGEKLYGLAAMDIAAKLPGMATSDYEKWMLDNNVTHAQIAAALGITLAEAMRRYPITKTVKAQNTVADTSSSDGGGAMATGGLMKLARGGAAAQFDLGDYSDGGRLLRGPGDGVSDSIPANIGNKRPARLADGEFVVPARIVSELGNGSTEAGARKLYAMMDRVQSARRGTVGKGKVAKNSRADKYLPV